MALWNILAGASGGLRQGLDDLRQRQIQDEQRTRQRFLEDESLKRQATLDKLQQDQIGFQKQQYADSQAQRALDNQRANAAIRAQGIELARSGVLSDKNALNQYYRDAGLDVEQVPGQATMQLSPLMQMALGRKSLTSNNLTGPDGQRVMQDRDYAAGQYGIVRQNQLADTAAQRAVEAKRLAEERAFQAQQQQAQQAFQERLANLQGRLSLQTAQAQRDFAPSFSTVTGQDGKVYSFNQRSGQINPLGIHAQDKATQQSALDAEKTIADILKVEFPYGVLPSQQALYNTRREQLRALARTGQLPASAAQPAQLTGPAAALQTITSMPGYPKK